MSNIALKHGIGFHTDCCLGGFVVPFAEKLGYKVPVVDFRLPGVTSMSVDTHKYGYAAKGTSVVLHRTEEQRRLPGQGGRRRPFAATLHRRRHAGRAAVRGFDAP